MHTRASCRTLSGILGERLPQVLPQLWMMTAAPDDIMVQDFANLVAPFANEGKAAIAELLEQVWKWEESAMRRKAHLAAAGMSLLLCETSLVRPYAPDAQEALANQVLAALTQLDSRGLHKATSLIGRGLTVLLRLGAGRRDDREFQQKLAAVLRRCGEEQIPQTALWVLVHVIQSLLDLHMQTQQEWYYEVVRSVSDYLQVSEETAAVDLDLFTPLINLYLQLPNRLPAAIDLMERQCEQLAATGDYKLLARYLSFLSDLLGRIEARNVSSASLLKILDRDSAGNASAEDATGEPESGTPAPEAHNMEQLREVATDLCARIIADLQLRPLARSTEQVVLYNAAKLLPTKRAPDLVTAIYAKLYDLADDVDGACVWGAYQAWSIGAAELNERFLEDSIALTTYSNCTDEGSDGRVQGSPRNYLITAQARNDLVHRLAARSTDAHLSTVHSQLELLRLIFLRQRVEDLQGYLHDLDQFKQVEFVTFLHDYLFSNRDGGPLWRRIKDIERHGENLESEIKKVIERMAMQGFSFSLEGSFASIFEAISFAVDDFLIDYRRRGRDLMQRFALAVRDFELGRILQEVQMFLRSGERSLIFDTLVQRDREQFPSQSSALQQLRDEYYESFLKNDSERVVPLLLAHALQLQRDGDAASAERFYRHLLARCETNADASLRLPAILSGLARSLRAQDRDEEARPFLTQEITLRSGSDDPELPSARVQLASILGETAEAEAVYRSALADCERILGAEHPETARTYNQLGVLLRRLGRPQEAEPLHRQALATCERVLGPVHPETLTSLINLAFLLHRKGDYGEAQSLYHRALEACERIFGPEHPTTLVIVDNLATLLTNKGDYAGTEPLLRRTLEARERVLGPEHPDTLESMDNLGARPSNGQNPGIME